MEWFYILLLVIAGFAFGVACYRSGYEQGALDLKGEIDKQLERLKNEEEADPE